MTNPVDQRLKDKRNRELSDKCHLIKVKIIDNIHNHLGKIFIFLIIQHSM
jgi:hypothetical protein